MKARQTGLLVALVGLLGSPAGHLVAYQLRFGAAAPRLQSSGAHAYFPGVVKTSLGTAAAIAVAGLLVVGLARALSRRRPGQRLAAPSLLRLLAALFTIQLAAFAAQETLEASLAGAPADSIAVLLLWGGAGQLPVALAAAAGLRWLAIRFEPAVERLRCVLSLPRPAPRLIFAPALALGGGGAVALTSSLAGAPGRKRGPPSSPRFTSE